MSRTKKEPQNPVTPEAEAKYDHYMTKWQVLLNLMDWRYVKDKRKSKFMAEISLQETEHRLVRWKIGSDFGNTPVTDETLESTACHENLHVLLHTLIEAAMQDGEYSDRVRGEEHRVIAVLEPMLLQLAQHRDAEQHRKTNESN